MFEGEKKRPEDMETGEVEMGEVTIDILAPIRSKIIEIRELKRKISDESISDGEKDLMDGKVFTLMVEVNSLIDEKYDELYREIEGTEYVSPSTGEVYGSDYLITRIKMLRDQVKADQTPQINSITNAKDLRKRVSELVDLENDYKRI